MAAWHTWMDKGPREPTGHWVTPLRTQLSHRAGEARRWDSGRARSSGRKGLGLQTGRACRKAWRGGEGAGVLLCGGSHGTLGPALVGPLPGLPGMGQRSLRPHKAGSARPGSWGHGEGWGGGPLRWVLGRDGG